MSRSASLPSFPFTRARLPIGEVAAERGRWGGGIRRHTTLVSLPYRVDVSSIGMHTASFGCCSGGVAAIACTRQERILSCGSCQGHCVSSLHIVETASGSARCRRRHQAAQDVVRSARRPPSFFTSDTTRTAKRNQHDMTSSVLLCGERIHEATSERTEHIGRTKNDRTAKAVPCCTRHTSHTPIDIPIPPARVPLVGPVRRIAGWLRVLCVGVRRADAVGRAVRPGPRFPRDIVDQ